MAGRHALTLAGLVAACGSPSVAQDAAVGLSAPMVATNPTAPAGRLSKRQPLSLTSLYYFRSCGGGPYKGFYPCNGKTPYVGGACNVYGDAPIYTAPADYGHHWRRPLPVSRPA